MASTLTATDATQALADRRLHAVLERVWRIQALHEAAMRRLQRRCQSLSRARPQPSLEDLQVQLDTRERAWQSAVAALGQPRSGTLQAGELPAEPDQPLWADEVAAAARKAVDSRPLPLPSFQRGMGLNAMKSYKWEDSVKSGGEMDLRYGAAVYDFQDAQDLGVAQARQFGVRDLFWLALTSWDDLTKRVPIPYDPDELRALVLDGPKAHAVHVSERVTNVQRFAELLEMAWRQRVKLRFTFLTLGGGTSSTVASGDSPDATPAPGLSAELLTWTTIPDGVHQENIVREYWSEEYLAHEGLSADSDEGKYYLCSLDMTVLAKKQAIQTMARACAALLVQAEQAVRAGAVISPLGESLTAAEREVFSLDQVLDGIELGNELDIRNMVTDLSGGPVDLKAVDPKASGRTWAGAWLFAAIGFLDEFRALRGARAVPPTLYLPGIASTRFSDVLDGTFTIDGGSRSWTYKAAFIDAMLSRITRVWDELRAPRALFTGYNDLPPLQDVIGGIDYHWYHARLDEKASPLHSGWLTTEVAAIAGILDANDLDARVTVYESGTAGLDSANVYYPGVPDGDSPTDAEAEAFQACEVWRRLLAAKAGGAEQVGWHAWMTGNSSRYDGFGLRVRPLSSVGARGALARPSWFAFQRLATLLRDAGEVRLVRPGADLLPTRAELTLGAVAGSVAGAGVFPDILVYEIAGLSVDALGGTVLTTYSYAYVALVDPTAPGAAPLSVVAAAPVGPDPGVLQLEPFTTDPAAWYIAPDLSSIPSEYQDVWLPTYAWWDSIPPPSAVALSPGGKAVFEVQRGGAPLVLLSKVRLSWPE